MHLFPNFELNYTFVIEMKSFPGYFATYGLFYSKDFPFDQSLLQSEKLGVKRGRHYLEHVGVCCSDEQHSLGEELRLVKVLGRHVADQVQVLRVDGAQDGSVLLLQKSGSQRWRGAREA